MAPGLGLFENAIVDQHFAERGRMGRLLGAVAQNPRMLGIGIDENTAIVVERKRMRVIGAGAVYVADGSSVTFSNPAETDDDKTLSIFGITLHVLATGDVFNLEERTPGRRPAAALSA
jgi:cyanophycinase